MIEGFIEIGSHEFYRDIWPQIEKRVEAIDSNLTQVKNKLAWAPSPPLVIYWGFKNKITGETTILAASRGNHEPPDQHWVSPSLLT